MIQAWGVTDKGGVRSQNQDAYYLKQMSDTVLAALVCDGMGGAKAGNVASTLAIDTASQYLESLSAPELAKAPGDYLTLAAELANSAVFERAVNDLACEGMGTTMVGVLLCGTTAKILNFGDSRAYLIGEDGIIRVTRDHSVVEEMVERGELTREEARYHPQKNLITRCIGVEEEICSDLYGVELREGEFLLLCTDGLTNLLTDQEILYEVLHEGAPEDCCQRLLAIALSRGAPDNVTVVLIKAEGGVNEDGSDDR